MLQINNLSAGILQGINFHVAKGSLTAICGPSGCGKTTLLNAIAGNIPAQGELKIDQILMSSIPPWLRPCRYLNQRLYLFPYLTLSGNLQLAQYAAGLKRDTKQRIAWLEKMGIAHLAHRYPRQISGGEQQRAALARALISQPKLLLLDEPFANLDWQTRRHLWDVIRQLHTDEITLVLVTHEPREAEALADQRWVFSQGQLVLLKENGDDLSF